MAAAGQARRVRADRADARLRLGRAGDLGPPRRRRRGSSTGRRSGSATAPSPTSSCVWARDVADGQVKGFLVEKGTPGYDARRIDGKGSLRAVWQAEITLTDVRVPEENRLPGAQQLQGHRPRCSPAPATRSPGRALGHATAAYEIAVAYCTAAHAVRQAAGRASRSCRTGWSRCSPRSARCSCTACGWAGSSRRAGSPTPSPRSRR